MSGSEWLLMNDAPAIPSLETTPMNRILALAVLLPLFGCVATPPATMHSTPGDDATIRALEEQERLTRVMPDALEWKDNPAFPKGVKIATVIGDPTRTGSVVVLRIKFPANFQMPPHTHPYSEVVTIISGSVGSSHGEKFEKKGGMMKPGALWVYPAKHAHYAWTENEEAILQVQFTGPGGIDYINPADDPRKK